MHCYFLIIVSKYAVTNNITFHWREEDFPKPIIKHLRIEAKNIFSFINISISIKIEICVNIFRKMLHLIFSIYYIILGTEI